VNGFIDYLYTPLRTTLYRSLKHTDYVISLLQSPLAVSWQRLYRRGFFRFSYSGPLVTASHAELSSTDNWTNWIRGLRPFHSSHLIFSLQADFQLTTDNWTLSLTNQLLHFTSLHFTSLNWTANDWLLRNSTEPAYNISAWTIRKTPFSCYSPTIPQPLHGYPLPREPIYRAVA
jgi:hypothetical protein